MAHTPSVSAMEESCWNIPWIVTSIAVLITALPVPLVVPAQVPVLCVCSDSPTGDTYGPKQLGTWYIGFRTITPPPNVDSTLWSSLIYEWPFQN